MYVELRNINKSYKDFKASKDVNLSIEQGKLVALLGPSGSGKTTILRMIAGLETPDSGDILIGGQRVNDVEPGKRGIGFVFQSYALFRHMTVFENVAFGLNIQKVDKKEIKKRVDHLIELVGLKGFEHRYPSQLSGGQRQRVAFARALAPNPKLLLLDEPFAAVDAKVRKELRRWLKDMISKLGITSIFVTHDQEEAVDVCDMIVVTNKGRIEQVGTPVDIYKDPHTSFVAQFMGESKVIEDYSVLKGFKVQDEGKCQAVVRPEFIEIAKDENEILTPLAAQKGIVKNIAFRGSNLEIEVQVGDVILNGYRSLEQRSVEIGEEVFVLVHKLYITNENRTYVLENEIKHADTYVVI